MKLQAMLVGLGLLHIVVGFDSQQSPDCVSRCWNNSKYVSTCLEADGNLCLCEDDEFQNVVLQCLYSQCQTTQFGSALHHALSECSDPKTGAPDIFPPLIRHQGLRKRGSQPIVSIAAPARVVMVSVSAKIAGHSVARRSVVASGIARFSARPLRSVIRSAAPTLSPTVSPLTTLFTSPTIAVSDTTSVQVPTKTS